MRAASCSAEEADAPSKPDGGYRLMAVPLVAAGWVSYRLKIIRLVDLRVWFAFHEMDSRRCLLEAPLAGKFTPEEARKLTGLSAKRIKDSLERLRQARLIEFDLVGLRLPCSADLLPVSETAPYRDFLARVVNANRKIPVPRRILRLLAGGARPALIATVLGHLIRGLYLKKGKCQGRGRVKASWIADTFGVSPRRVKEARHELIALGWLIPLEADQWALNRWGAHFRIHLGWSRGEAAVSRSSADSKLAPPPPVSEPKLAPPAPHEKPLSGREKNQKPASGGPAGNCISENESKIPEGRTAVPKATIAAPPAPKSPFPAGKPALGDVVISDLANTGRLLDLYHQAIARGWVTSSERDRLRFVGAAEHARIIGTKNPCGLFVMLIRSGLWSFITQDDEDAAAARLKRHLHPCPEESIPLAVAAKRDKEFLSDDAKLVRAIRGALGIKGFRGDAFPFLKQRNSEWTRERWNRALDELAGSPGTMARPQNEPNWERRAGSPGTMAR